jgi:protein Mpv17
MVVKHFAGVATVNLVFVLLFSLGCQDLGQDLIFSPCCFVFIYRYRNQQHTNLLNKMAGLWARYNALLEAQPLLTKALTSLTGFTAGDILAQKFIEPGDKPYDVMRTIRLGSFGFLLHGTTGHYFYGFLDSKLPGTAPVTVASKVAIDQTLWNPIFGLMFFGYLNVMEGKSFDDYVNKIKADLKTAVMGSWAVWVPAHTINFAFVPPSQRLLYINTIQIGYNVFLSFLGNKEVKKGDDKEL